MLLLRTRCQRVPHGTLSRILRRSFCSSALSDRELLALHETDPSQAASIYLDRIKAMDESESTRPSLFHYYMHLRDCYWRLNDTEQISECTNKLYQLNPSHFYSNYVMAVETFDVNLQLDFLLNAEKYITDDTPTNMIADVIYRIAANYSRQKDLTNARAYILKLDDIEQESYQVRKSVFLAYLDSNQGDSDSSIQHLKSAVELEAVGEEEMSAKRHALQQLALHHAQTQRDFRTANELYLQLYYECNHRVLEVFQSICVCYKNQAVQLYQAEQYAQCIELYQRLLDFIHDNEKQNELEWTRICDKYKLYAMKQTAQCYNIQNDTHATYEWLMKVLEMSPNDWLSNYYVARYAMSVEKDVDKALNHLMVAQGDDAKSSSGYDEISTDMRANAQQLMAIIYSKKGEFQRANVCMEIALSLCNEATYLYTALAMIQAKQRQYDKAWQNLKIANELRTSQRSDSDSESNGNDIAAHLKGIENAIQEFEFEFSAQNNMALKCLIMVEYLRGNAIECMQYADQYRNAIDGHDEDVNVIFQALAEKL